jgi:hypothetical protein
MMVKINNAPFILNRVFYDPDRLPLYIPRHFLPPLYTANKDYEYDDGYDSSDPIDALLEN